MNIKILSILSSLLATSLVAGINMGQGSGFVVNNGELDLEAVTLTNGLLVKNGGTISGTFVLENTELVDTTSGNTYHAVASGWYADGVVSLQAGDVLSIKGGQLPADVGVAGNARIDGFGSQASGNGISIVAGATLTLAFAGVLSEDISAASATVSLDSDITMAAASITGASSIIVGNDYQLTYLSDGALTLSSSQIIRNTSLVIEGATTISAALTFDTAASSIDACNSAITIADGGQIKADGVTLTIRNAVITTADSETSPFLLANGGVIALENTTIDGFLITTGSMSAYSGDRFYESSITFGTNTHLKMLKDTAMGPSTAPKTWTFGAGGILDLGGNTLNMRYGALAQTNNANIFTVMNGYMINVGSSTTAAEGGVGLYAFEGGAGSTVKVDVANVKLDNVFVEAARISAFTTGHWTRHDFDSADVTWAQDANGKLIVHFYEDWNSGGTWTVSQSGVFNGHGNFFNCGWGGLTIAAGQTLSMKNMTAQFGTGLSFGNSTTSKLAVSDCILIFQRTYTLSGVLQVDSNSTLVLRADPNTGAAITFTANNANSIVLNGATLFYDRLNKGGIFRIDGIDNPADLGDVVASDVFDATAGGELRQVLGALAYGDADVGTYLAGLNLVTQAYLVNNNYVADENYVPFSPFVPDNPYSGAVTLARDITLVNDDDALTEVALTFDADTTFSMNGYTLKFAHDKHNASPLITLTTTLNGEEHDPTTVTITNTRIVNFDPMVVVYDNAQAATNLVIGDQVKLEVGYDIEWSGFIQFAPGAGSEVILDLQGHTLELDPTSSNHLFTKAGDGTLTICNGRIVNPGKISLTAGTLTFQDVELVLTDAVGAAAGVTFAANTVQFKGNCLVTGAQSGASLSIGNGAVTAKILANSTLTIGLNQALSYGDVTSTSLVLDAASATLAFMGGSLSVTDDLHLKKGRLVVDHTSSVTVAAGKILQFDDGSTAATDTLNIDLLPGATLTLNGAGTVQFGSGSLD